MSKRSNEYLKQWRIKTHGAHADRIIADLENNLKQNSWNIPCKAYHYLCSALIVKLFSSLPDVFKKKLVEHLAEKTADNKKALKDRSASSGQ